mgnify:CR=1 FL=1
MPSETKSVREAQRARCEEAIQRRLALLRERGAPQEEIAGDARLRHLRADLRRTLERLRVIETREKQAEAIKLKKQKASEEKTAPKEPAPLPQPREKAKKKKTTPPKAES